MTNISKWVNLVLIIVLFLWASTFVIGEMNSTTPIIQPLVFKKLATQNEARIFIILKENNEVRKAMSQKRTDENLDKVHKEITESIDKVQSKVLFQLSDTDFRIKHQFRLTPAISGYITKNGLDKIKDNPYIERISMVKKTKADLIQSVPLIDVSAIQSIGYKGRGITVCVIDTGINYSHPSLGNCSPTNNINDGSCSKVIGGYNYCGDEECSLANENHNPMDNNGHGTRVAGIAASTHSTYKGTASNTKLVAIKAQNSTQGGWADDLADGIEWCRLNASRLNISVITISIHVEDGNYYDSDCNSGSDNVEDNINQAYSDGIFVSASSGNKNNLTGINRPACAAGAVSVGSVYDENLGIQFFIGICTDWTTEVDNISCFTNRAQNLDLLAPGCNISSTTISGGFEGGKCGTSFATPHVAGAAALLIQYNKKEFNKNLSPDEVRTRFNETGKLIFDDATNLTFSRIDAYNALFPVDVEDEAVLNASGRRRVLGFTVKNNKNIPLNDVNWTVYSGDGNVIFGDYDFNFSANESLTVVVEHNFSEGKNKFEVNITARADGIQDDETLSIKMGLDVAELIELDSFGTLKVFGFNIANWFTSDLSDVNWSLDTGEAAVNASDLINLIMDENVTVVAEYNYATPGTYLVVANATSALGSDYDTLTISMAPGRIANLSVLNSTGKQRTFEFIIINDLLVNLSHVNWTLDTGENTITANQNTTLLPKENLSVVVGYNYTSPNDYMVNATAINNTWTDSVNISITVT